jgi:uncharacterized protein
MIAARASLVALLMCWAFMAFADVAVPPLSGRVVDQTGTLSSDTVASLTQTLKDLQARKGSQIAVLIVPTTAPETIEQYSIRVAEAWKIGRKKIDDGALLVAAKNDRKLRIEVGYGLEGGLTDATASRIISEIITPKFRSGDFAGGISDGVERMIAVIDGEPLPAPEPTQSFGEPAHLEDLLPILLFVAVIVGGLSRALLGRLIGSVATGGIIGVVAWFMIGSLALCAISAVIAFFLTMFADSFVSGGGGRSGRSGGFVGGGGGSWSGGSSSSSDSGGFSGGGGSFGGGGASGSW